MTSRAEDLGVPARARTAWAELGSAIATTGPTPCQGENRDRWTGSPRDQLWAAERCLDCPAMVACLTYARIAGERDGAWGGTTAADRYPKVGTTKRRTAHNRKEQPTHG